MIQENYCIDINVIVLIRECYGKFNSHRVAKLGMQKVTDTFQFVAYKRKTDIVNHLYKTY